MPIEEIDFFQEKIHRISYNLRERRFNFYTVWFSKKRNNSQLSPGFFFCLILGKKKHHFGTKMFQNITEIRSVDSNIFCGNPNNFSLIIKFTTCAQWSPRAQLEAHATVRSGDVLAPEDPTLTYYRHSGLLYTSFSIFYVLGKVWNGGFQKLVF